ncbi:MAG: hypothetical protein R6V84_09950 [Desulfobacterales bacterium]
MQSIAAIKMLLLEILESAFQGADVHATQQMGVSMSNAVKREGVVIIQNQNVEVYARIMPLMVKTLKLCDAVETNRLSKEAVEIEPQQKQLPPPATDDSDPIESCCAWLYDNHITWQAMQDLMKARYLEYVIGRFKTKAEAAKWLGVGSTYLSKLTSLHAADRN